MLILILAALFTAAIWQAAAISAQDQPDEVLIFDSVYEGQHLKGPVKFPHKKHVTELKITCQECHHIYENGENVWKETDPPGKCHDCHQYDADEGKKYRMKAGKVFHNLCRNCHKEKDAPTKCQECHQPKQ